MKNWLTALFYPVDCLLCGRPGADSLCSVCLQNLPAGTCCLCGGAIQNFSCVFCSASFEVESFLALLPYSHIQEFILQVKAGSLYPQNIDLFKSFPQCFPEDADLILLPARNEHWMQKILGPDRKLEQVLQKTRGKLSQKLLNREMRLKNALRLYALRPEFRRVQERAVLIDDVSSTGASLRSCIFLLRELGYKNLSVFVFAGQTKLK